MKNIGEIQPRNLWSKTMEETGQLTETRIRQLLRTSLSSFEALFC